MEEHPTRPDGFTHANGLSSLFEQAPLVLMRGEERRGDEMRSIECNLSLLFEQAPLVLPDEGGARFRRSGPSGIDRLAGGSEAQSLARIEAIRAADPAPGL